MSCRLGTKKRVRNALVEEYDARVGPESISPRASRFNDVMVTIGLYGRDPVSHTNQASVAREASWVPG